MHHSVRYNCWNQPDSNDYTQDWEPDLQSAWSSAAEQVPQQYNKHPSTQNRGNNDERIPQHYNNTQNRENNQENTQQQYNSPSSTQNRENNQERTAQQYNPQPSTQNRENNEGSNPQPRPVEYASEWYLPHRNTLSGSQSTPHNSHTDTAKQKELYYGQAQYPIRNDQKIEAYVGDVYGYNEESVDGGTYQVPQQTGSSIQDPLVATGQKELKKNLKRKEYFKNRDEMLKARKRAKQELRMRGRQGVCRAPKPKKI
ncbi:hypothetical protein QAD02_004865 [Eretmocerus hayati]|uniref:Uncharacterized protein n=1 Tax=Eretmocerus hayati TaxID=131215 RepID=A0ACC2NRV5_9HYME|nr:hypothetical protein QAD02_004865 [Eretmocerus hayati]